MVDIILLGCGGNASLPNRLLSSVFINYESRKILIDCGEATQLSMKMKNCGFKNLDLICITHLHGDHTFGLPALLSTMGNSGRCDDVTIIGPPGIVEIVEAIKVFMGYFAFNINVIENPKDLIIIDKGPLKNVEISTLPLMHSTECIGYSFNFKRRPKFDINKATKNEVPKYLWQKLQSGNSITINNINYTPDMVLGQNRNGIKVSITTDTRPIDTICDFIKNSDLFICEGMYGDDLDISKAVKNQHMTFREAATLAKNGEVKRLLLTHFSPSLESPNKYLENATSVFKNTIIGEDRLELNLKFED